MTIGVLCSVDPTNIGSLSAEIPTNTVRCKGGKYRKRKRQEMSVRQGIPFCGCQGVLDGELDPCTRCRHRRSAVGSDHYLR
eukprot:3697788-Pyramimonas_sp.AAC.1